MLMQRGDAEGVTIPAPWVTMDEEIDECGAMKVMKTMGGQCLSDLLFLSIAVPFWPREQCLCGLALF